MYSVNEMWGLIIEYGIATKEELELVTCIEGYNIDILECVVYVRTGYRNIEELIKEVE